jgi:hypothetical protein
MRSSTNLSNPGLNSSASAKVSSKEYVGALTDNPPNRIEALDFTKGALVLFMVLYHWLVYFHGAYGSIFRYLRFLPPSFIFITGFLISNAYLAKYKLTDPRLPKRLAIRGLKVMAVFVALNLLISSLFLGLRNLNVESFIASFVSGNVFVAGFGKAAAFTILVPISYLLLLSALLVIACRLYKYTFYLVLLLFALGNALVNFDGVKSNNLELIIIGLLGVVLGYAPLEKINSVLKHRYWIIAAYLCYLAIISSWDPDFAFQTLGVVLTLMMIYMLGASMLVPAGVQKQIILLGRYPLFGYIAQIAILQVLRRSLVDFDLEPALLASTFIGAAVLTLIAVTMMHFARAKSPLVDRFYKAIFV